MQTAQLFIDGENQAVRLPEECAFRGQSVYVKKVGEAVLLIPVDKEWEVFMHGINSFSDDFMSEGRLHDNVQERDDLKVENWV